MFARFGLPEELVSDNGPQFTSEEFAQFLQMNGVKHTRTPRYHPSSNGLAERMVQELKSALNKGQHLQKFLMAYRNTPHCTTGQSPSDLFLKRQIRTRLTLLKPNLASHVENKQSSAVTFHDRGTKKVRSFEPGDFVSLRNFRGSMKWVPATVLQRRGPMNYIVRQGHREISTHIDHLKPALTDKWERPFNDVEDDPADVHLPTPSVEPCRSPPSRNLSDVVSMRVHPHFKTQSGRVVKKPNKLDM